MIRTVRLTCGATSSPRPPDGVRLLRLARSEIWVAEHRHVLPAGLFACVGASVDFFAGAKKHAPIWAQRSGLEWLYRLLLEPGRLWRRYLVHDLAFVPEIAGSASCGPVAGAVRPRPASPCDTQDLPPVVGSPATGGTQPPQSASGPAATHAVELDESSAPENRAEGRAGSRDRATVWRPRSPAGSSRRRVRTTVKSPLSNLHDPVGAVVFPCRSFRDQSRSRSATSPHLVRRSATRGSHRRP